MSGKINDLTTHGGLLPRAGVEVHLDNHMLVVRLESAQLARPLGRLPIRNPRVAEAGRDQDVRIGLGADVVVRRVPGV